MNAETVIAVRKMEEADIPEGMRLKEAAGWNQTCQDWRRLLTLEPNGCFVACEGTVVRGTVTTLSYGNCFGWIGMLLTAAESRKRGIGTLLLRAAVSYLERNGVKTLRLDGTPMGYGLYARHGFVDEYEIQRWEGLATVRRAQGLARLRESDLSPVCAWDRSVFGADRSRLIISLWRDAPACSAVAYSAGEIAGYALWRPGTRAWYLGPLAARTGGTTETLLMEALNRLCGQPVFVDICTVNSWGIEMLQSLGFRHQRNLIRMYRGPHASCGEPEHVCAIAGLELG